jgi:HAD superfamily hydrolase (TIGR01509 family)
MTERLLRPQGVAFDCDGLLVDTETCWTIAESGMFSARGLTFTPELKAQFIGTTIDWTVARMAETFDELGRDALLKTELTDRVSVVIEEQAEPMAGAIELVELLIGRLPLVVVSNSERRLVSLALARAGLSGAFSAIVAAEDVPHGKPAPDLYLRACELLGTQPAQALAFEDSLVGVNAAKAAGVTVVGIPTLIQDGFAPDHRYDTLGDPELLAWAGSL